MVKERGVRYLRYVLLFVSLLALLGSVGTTEASIYSSLIKRSQTPVSSPEVILQNGTAGTSTIYTNNTSAKVSVEAPLFDYVDSNDPDVNSSADKGAHSNFSAQQENPDSIYDTLAEENTEAIEDYVDNNLGDVDSSSDVGSHSNFENQKDYDSIYDTLTEQNTGVGITKVGTDTSGTGTNLTLSFSHTLVSGTTRIVIVSIGVENGDTIDVSTVTYGGVAMTLAVDGITGTSAFRFLCEIWYILEYDLPSDGSQTVEINCSGTAYELEVNGFCSEYTGVTQGIPEATAEHNQTTGTTITNDISPSENAWVISTVGSGNVGSFTHGQGQVEVLDFQDTSSAFAVAELRGASGETSLDSTYSGTLNRLERVTASWTEAIEEHNYELDLEIQFTAVIDFLPTETLCINTGAFSGTEYLNVDFWNGTGWENLATDLTAYSCNDYAVSLTSSTFTVRFRDETTVGDTIQDQWQIDASLLRVEGAGSKEDAVDQQSNIDGSVDIGTHSNFTAEQYGPDSINDTLTETDTSGASDNNNVDSEIITDGSTTGISGAQTVGGITENMTEGTQPSIEGTPEVAEGDSTTFTVNVPGDVSGGIQSGDYIVVVAMHCESEDNTWGIPSGMDGEWISELQVGGTPPSIPGTQVFYELCEGGESGTRSSVGTFAGGWVAICFVVRGVNTTTPLDVAPTTAQGTGGQPNPPSITPTSDNCMIIIVGFMDDSETTGTISDPPSPYTLIEDQVQTSTPTNGRIGVAYRILATAQTEDPGSWTMDGNDEWAGITIALGPTANYQLDIEHVVNSIGNYQSYNLTTRAYRTASENYYLQLYNFTSSQWVNMSTITASTLTWYNTTFAKINFVNATDQARIRYWQGEDAAQETLYVDYSGVYGWNATNYELDLEVQWTSLHYSLPNENLSIYSGTMGTEDIKVDVWNGTGWETLFTDLSSGWNNASVTGWLTTSNITIRFKGGNETGDSDPDTWNIDVAIIGSVKSSSVLFPCKDSSDGL